MLDPIEATDREDAVSDWLERHGMSADERVTCLACLTWEEGHAHPEAQILPIGK